MCVVAVLRRLRVLGVVIEAHGKRGGAGERMVALQALGRVFGLLLQPLVQATDGLPVTLLLFAQLLDALPGEGLVAGEVVAGEMGLVR